MGTARHIKQVEEVGKCGLLDVQKTEESKQPRKKVTLEEPN